MSGGHDLEHEETYQERPEEVAKREARNKARYQMLKRGLVHKHDGKDIDHTHPLEEGGTNSPSNWRVRTVHANRSEGDMDKKNRPI